MNHDEITNIPKDRVVTYARVVVDFRPQKDDPNRVRITAGGNLINYPGELTTCAADLTTSKVYGIGQFLQEEQNTYVLIYTVFI